MHSSLSNDLNNYPAILQCAQDLSLQFINKLPTAPVCGKPPMKEVVGDDLQSEGVGALAVLEEFWKGYGDSFSGSAGPRYFGFVTGGGTPAAVSADWLVSVLDQNTHLSNDSAACAIELATVAMLRQLLTLPNNLCGKFVSGATMANFVSLAVARQFLGSRVGVDIAEEGVAVSPPIRVITAAAHSSIAKSLSMLGMGRRACTEAPVIQGTETIDVKALDLLLSLTPTVLTIVVANAGTVNTASFDDMEALIVLRDRYGFWLHVDAAFGGIAGASPTHSHLLKGWGAADSITVDAHKWLNVPYDSAIQFTADRHLELQIQVFKNMSPYLASAEVRPDNYLHLAPENSRRFRALPVWMSLKAYGKDGFQNIVDRNVSLATILGSKIEESSGFKLLAPVILNVVCFALKGVASDASPSESRDRFLKLLNEAGVVRCTPTLYNGTPGIRAALVNWMTESKDIDLAFASMVECRNDV